MPEGHVAPVITVYLGLGANLGDRRQNLQRALDLLAPGIQVKRISSIYETEPEGFADQPRFLNAVLCGTTRLHPHDVLKTIKEIESRLGRKPAFRNAPRPIDIDILFYGDRVVDSPELCIPHPRLAERGFVLVPLAEIAPDLLHPVSGRRMADLLRDLGNIQGVEKWEEARNV